uniref:Uncharacterized protein n=1 Tax=Arundo donax TaxID=35708 RepID=A0A0A8ZE52_ARUDO
MARLTRDAKASPKEMRP